MTTPLPQPVLAPQAPSDEVLPHDMMARHQFIMDREAALALGRTAPPADPQWQPIETAPKDGSHFLACDAARTFGRMDGKALPAWQTVVHWWGHGEPGFYTSVNEVEPERPFPATHWKPLDSPTGGV